MVKSVHDRNPRAPLQRAPFLFPATFEKKSTFSKRFEHNSEVSLLEEWDLARVLYLTKRDADPSEGLLKIDGSPELTLALLRDSRSEVRSQSLGSRAVRRFPQLAWDVLIELYGDEATLRERIESLKAANPKGAEDLLALADKYLSGWRPNRFGED
jgi:hypothetical protein